MPEPGSSAPPPSTKPDLPQYWRIPPWQPAALLLAVSGLMAVVIYGSPSVAVKIACAFVALLFVVGAVPAIRYLLVADEQGIWIRTVLKEHGVLWPEFRDADVIDTKRGASTLRIYRHDGTFLDVPPSLLQPTLPTKIEKAQAVVRGVAAQLEHIAATRRP